MSDTFDHEGDAWDDYERRHEGDESGHGWMTRGPSNFNYDPLHYHTKVKFRCLSNTTEKAVQLELEDGRQAWVPRSVCREWKKHSVWVHRATWMKSLKSARKPDHTALIADAPGYVFDIPDRLEDLLDDEDRPF